MNIAELSIKKSTITWTMTILLLVVGYFAYQGLPRLEDPEFAIKEAVIITPFPGASAREVESSPIYGMPVINADKAKTVMVLKRSMAAGFAGVDNPLFVNENTRMLFGDAKATVQQLVAEFKES